MAYPTLKSVSHPGNFSPLLVQRLETVLDNCSMKKLFRRKTNIIAYYYPIRFIFGKLNPIAAWVFHFWCVPVRMISIELAHSRDLYFRLDF